VVDQHLVGGGGGLAVVQTVVSDEERSKHEVVVDHHSTDKQQKPGQLQQERPTPTYILGQLSLASLRGRLIEYQLRLW